MLEWDIWECHLLPHMPQGAVLGERLARDGSLFHKHCVEKQISCLTVTFWTNNAIRVSAWKKEG